MTGPLEVFQAANELLCLNSRDQEYQKEQEGYELVFSALQPGLVPTSSELGFYADNSLGMKPANSLLVPGGMVAETISDDSKIVQAIHLAAQKHSESYPFAVGHSFLRLPDFQWPSGYHPLDCC